jgi:hypothetical protein
MFYASVALLLALLMVWILVSTLGQPRRWTRNPIAWILLLFFVAIPIGIIYVMLTQ